MLATGNINMTRRNEQFLNTVMKTWLHRDIIGHPNRSKNKRFYFSEQTTRVITGVESGYSEKGGREV